MLFSVSEIGALAILLSLATGFLVGVSVGFLAVAALHVRRRALLDGLSGMIGFTTGHLIGISARGFAIEVNGAIVGWQRGHDWLGLRGWVFEHALSMALVTCLAAVPLGRGLARMFAWGARSASGR